MATAAPSPLDTPCKMNRSNNVTEQVWVEVHHLGE
jgi:hypothetical protein